MLVRQKIIFTSST